MGNPPAAADQALSSPRQAGDDAGAEAGRETHVYVLLSVAASSRHFRPVCGMAAHAVKVAAAVARRSIVCIRLCIRLWSRAGVEQSGH